MMDERGANEPAVMNVEGLKASEMDAGPVKM